MAIIFSFPSFFHISFLSLLNVHPIIIYLLLHSSLYILHYCNVIPAIQVLCEYLKTHIYIYGTCNCFYNYSYILLLE
jgi:hypothetical protein